MKNSCKLTGTTIFLEVILLTKKEVILAQKCIWIRTLGQLEHMQKKQIRRKLKSQKLMKGLD